MIRFIASRLAGAIVAVLGVVTIVFFVTRVVGDPTSLLLPVGASESDLHALRVSLGLDQPLLTQYGVFLHHVMSADFGTSFEQMRPAMQLVFERMPATLLLASVALVAGVLLGSIAGCVAALKRGSLVEFAVMSLALLGQATPVFWLGIMLIMYFAVHLGWLPSGGYGQVSDLILPALTLSVYVAASIARLLRSSVLEVLHEDYVRTAIAKGLMPRTVFLWHVVRNALIPVLTMTGIIAGELLGGSVVTETVFSWPGLGRLIVQAVSNQDFPVVQAGVTVIAVIFVLVNLAVDMLYAVVDPRVSA